MFHGLDRQSLNELYDVGRSDMMSELETLAKEQFVTLVLAANGWKLSIFRTDCHAGD